MTVTDKQMDEWRRMTERQFDDLNYASLACEAVPVLMAEVERLRGLWEVEARSKEADNEEIAQLQAQAGAMRAALELFRWPGGRFPPSPVQDVVLRALATDAGRAFSERMKALESCATSLRECAPRMGNDGVWERATAALAALDKVKP